MKKMDDKIHVLMSGLPGNMATRVALKIADSKDIDFVYYALSDHFDGSRTLVRNNNRGKYRISLRSPNEHKASLMLFRERSPGIVVDFTIPDAVNRNAELYCEVGVPFVMGTTGGDRDKLVETVKNSNIPAVIAPNMGIPLVLVQSMLEYASKMFPSALSGFTLEIVESHQETKKDTSGTAKAFQSLFEKLGATIRCGIISIRDKVVQEFVMGIKEVNAHGYHWYKLYNKDGTVTLELATKVDGRHVYADGTLEAIRFLNKKIQEGSKGEVFTMIDVLKSLNQ